MVTLSPSLTVEAEEVVLLGADEVTYDSFAFPQVAGNVREFYQELAAGYFHVHLGVILNGIITVNVVRPEYP